VFVDFLGPHPVRPGRMRATTADGPGRLRPGHRAAEARNARNPVSLAGPSDGVTHARADRRTVRLSPVGLKCRDRPTDQVEADVGAFDVFAAFSVFGARRRRFGAGSASADPAAAFLSLGSATEITLPASIRGRCT